MPPRPAAPPDEHRARLGLTLRRSSGRSASSLSGEAHVARKFVNGDSYQGGWRGGCPHGDGSYCWADGSTYEGGWLAGRKDGMGTYTWPNGASYRGEWRDGCMHGVGTFESPDGTYYQGGWAGDVKQGLGRKVYANGDVYEGLWRAGKCDGPGRYRWQTGNEYDGEWKAGRMHGQGTLRWSTSDRYDGEFRDGEEHGLGIFTWADGATYDGFWRTGRKHGLGVFRPAPPGAVNARATVPFRPHGLPRSGGRSARGGEDADDMSADTSGAESSSGGGSRPRGAGSDVPVTNPSLSGAASTGFSAGSQDFSTGCAALPSATPTGGSGGGLRTGFAGERPEMVYLREYEEGHLISEALLSPEEVAVAVGGAPRRRPERRRRRGTRRRGANRLGETIYKGHRSYDLMLNLQLGIRWSMTHTAARPDPQPLLQQHFIEKVKQGFPRDGGGATPPHPSGDFKWKDYAPHAFRRLRAVFAIDTADFMASVCGDQALRELPSPGKSGSVFFLSHDDKYLIKTMRKGEMKLLQEILPKYCAHVEKYPNTLLIKFFGLHRVKPAAGSNVRFVVMNNIFQTALPIHRQYDLKGSTQGRQSRAPAPRYPAVTPRVTVPEAAPAAATPLAAPVPPAPLILKDLDLDIALKLEEGWHERLMAQLAADCALLEELRVMDYSLLLGVHMRSAGGYASSPLPTDKEDEATDEEPPTPTPSAAQRSGPPVSKPATNASADADAVGNGAPLVAGLPEGLPRIRPRPPAPIASPDGQAAHLANGQVGTPGGGSEAGGGALARIAAALGGRVGEKRLTDLARLAELQMLGGRAARAWRSPTLVLARRPQRSTTMRPVAYTEGGTDDLAHSMGHTRAHLGVHMAATALPQGAAGDAAPEDVVVYFGIIDILQDYNMSKRFEHGFKSLLTDGSTISAVDPRLYSRRFQEFLKKVFV